MGMMSWMVGRKVAKIAQMSGPDQVSALREMAGQVATMPAESKRREMIRLMQESVERLPEDQRKNLLENRMKAISQLGPKERMLLMRSMDAVMGKGGMGEAKEATAGGGVPGSGDDVMTSMVRTLAAMPETQRRSMIDSRMQTFLAIGEEDRVQGMAAMVEAGAGLPREDHQRLVKTRTVALCAFSHDQRETLAQSHMMAVQKVPVEVATKELEAMGQAVMSLSDADRATFVHTMKHLMGNMPPPMREQMMGKLPPMMKQMLMA